MDARHPGDMEQHETSPLVETTSPKDGTSRTTPQDLPSRSYFSSHGNYDPQTGTRYSASIESIRAHSVALGDLQMSDDTTSRLDESRLSISRSPPITVESTGSSNLSLLLDQHNAQLNHRQQPPSQHRIKKTPTFDEESSPLLQVKQHVQLPQDTIQLIRLILLHPIIIINKIIFQSSRAKSFLLLFLGWIVFVNPSRIYLQ